MFYVRCCSVLNVLILTLLCVLLFNLVKLTELPPVWERAANSAYRGLTGEFLLLQNFSVAISVSPHVCFILVLILISMFLR